MNYNYAVKCCEQQLGRGQLQSPDAEPATSPLNFGQPVHVLYIHF